MSRIETEHHDGTSDATPGGYEGQRRPGELIFGALMVIGSLVLLWNAYGISGFEALSAPGTVPMATTAVMVVTSAIILLRDLRLPRVAGESVAKDILPGVVLIIALMLVAYGFLLQPLGFLPTSALFLIAALKLLARRGWLWTVSISIGSLLLVWIIFRIVFSVLMPAGIVPEAELIQAFRNLFSGGQ
ncbi:tripartite tricarboxylate transporter TctB family protein [Salipiger thiooxidans]|jgi:putative tricarboxylic transport membrane protein|uniref:tripartite tricarboxylate transporter TctB family protein n=1 Tax=Salipiger thiooxidans TaxID=282683 RepID=UPI001A8C6927|nr:tripartite tricarboxylate transporter TctB family protein [Salipiger thiooxidans]MBN8190139.1 tripartite tricarboxylate transporter TctB family protein [Salipiger thiooxidans]MBR9841410.1 tripartite tricarboxylate transporter TctB family protein [Paracoccaceae bacterium]MCA0849828.1 tripartite tricarboxylate transporter TctB family protein [Salipiger thiooxidans]